MEDEWSLESKRSYKPLLRSPEDSWLPVVSAENMHWIGHTELANACASAPRTRNSSTSRYAAGGLMKSFWLLLAAS